VEKMKIRIMKKGVKDTKIRQEGLETPLLTFKENTISFQLFHKEHFQYFQGMEE
jgi:hypothetical protein